MAERIKVYQCKGCGHRTIVFAGFCPECREREPFLGLEVPGRGSLYAFTGVHVCEERLRDEAPYLLAIIEGEGGFKMMGRLIRSVHNPLKIGMPVELIEKREGEYLFGLVEKS